MTHLISHICRWLTDCAYNIVDEVLLPRYCPVCGQVLQRQEEVVCLYCLTRIPYTNLPSPTDNPMIRRMWAREDVERATSLFYYLPHTKYSRLIINIKYHYNPIMAVQLGRMAAQMLQADWENSGVDCIVPVPIHWRRWLVRGYNQAERIAQGIASVYNLPVLKGVLRRHTYSTSQTKLGASERWRNAQNVYHAHVPEEWRGRHIMLVDDVCTTGSTLCACMQALRASDPTLTISCFTLAQTDR